MNLEHEKAISEITIAPDGRILVFGMSKQVLAVLEAMGFVDADLKQRIDLVRKIQGSTPPVGALERNTARCSGARGSRAKETDHG